MLVILRSIVAQQALRIMEAGDVEGFEVGPVATIARWIPPLPSLGRADKTVIDELRHLGHGCTDLAGELHLHFVGNQLGLTHQN